VRSRAQPLGDTIGTGRDMPLGNGSPTWLRTGRRIAAKLVAILGTVSLTIGCYLLAIRPAQLRWGASAEEIARPLPGDSLVKPASLLATRATTIAARPDEIWPWIVQIGYGRGGFYGYDLIENLGSPRGIRSAGHLVPEFQHPWIGDRIYMSRLAYLKIHALEPNRFLVWASDEQPPHGAFTFAIFPIDDRHSRLLVRARLRYHWTDPLILLDLFTEFGDHVAVPRMMQGIRDRAEGRPIEPLGVQGFEIAVWIATLLEFLAALAMIAARRHWTRAMAAALMAGAALLFVLYARAPLWIGAIPQVPVLTALIWAGHAGAKTGA